MVTSNFSIQDQTGSISLGQAAMALARQGYRVFPLSALSKVPRFKNWPWQECATTEERYVQDWWTHWPDSNIGVVADDLTIVDVDRKNGVDGWQTVGHLIDQDTFSVATPNNGFHFYYNGSQVQLKKRPGVDIQHGLKYVVGPYSRLPEGVYQPINGSEVAPLPKALAEFLGKAPEAPPPADLPDLLENPPSMPRGGLEFKHLAFLDHGQVDKAFLSRSEVVQSIAARLYQLGYDDAQVLSMLWNDPQVQYVALEHWSGDGPGWLWHGCKKVRHHKRKSAAEVYQPIPQPTTPIVPIEDKPKTPSHHEITQDLMDLTVKETGNKLVACEGKFWTCKDGSVWEPTTLEDMAVKAAGNIPPSGHFKTKGHYNAVTKHLYDRCAAGPNREFFENAPRGVVTDGWFLRLSDQGELGYEALGPDHRQRFALPATVSWDVAWWWLSFLLETFKDNDPVGQTRLLQEIAGSVLFGLAAEQQKAFLFKGVTRAGKGVVQRMLAKLVPPSYVSAISPYDWDDKRATARMAGARLNNVGELERRKSIPAGAFKSYIGQDTIESAQVYKVGFSHRNQAAHIFSSNDFVPTNDRQEAFFSRWVCLEFAHSKGESDRVPNLEDQIAEAELPEILGWAIQGAQRLIAQGQFSLTGVHHRMMDEWQRETSTVLCFLHDPDAVELGPDKSQSGDTMYRFYKNWCAENGRKALGKQYFYGDIETSGIVTRRRTGSVRSLIEGACTRMESVFS